MAQVMMFCPACVSIIPQTDRLKDIGKGSVSFSTLKYRDMMSALLEVQKVNKALIGQTVLLFPAFVRVSVRERL